MITKPSIYTDEDRQKVIDFFLNSTNNKISVIATETGYKTSFINSTLDKYFKEKMKNKKR